MVWRALFRFFAVFEHNLFDDIEISIILAMRFETLLFASWIFTTIGSFEIEPRDLDSDDLFNDSDLDSAPLEGMKPIFSGSWIEYKFIC